ncbi:MAG TPA: FadR/GntR family transcriptional regulator [Acetobacteraceae bacterium]|nr:FadR/GntR family transcriptional regulator [Acetobacteraceae bacterium]
MPFNAIETRRLYQAVADQIAQMIRADEFRPGDRLPTERDLVRQLGVSRPVIREAMIALEIAGLVEVRSGSGVYVTSRPPAAVTTGRDTGSSEVGPFELFTARLAVEGEVAAVAAEHATAHDLAEMAAANEQMRLAVQAGRSTKPANQRFHLAIAIAAKNPILLKVMHVLWAELPKRGPIWARLEARRQLRSTRVVEHESILRAIAERNGENARTAMRAHLQAAIKDYLDGAPIDPAGSESNGAQQRIVTPFPSEATLHDLDQMW